jgi:hypothetical protein
MKERMVTKFYRVTDNAVGAATANPKNRTESRGAADFTNHYSLITSHLCPGRRSDVVSESRRNELCLSLRLKPECLARVNYAYESPLFFPVTSSH